MNTTFPIAPLTTFLTVEKNLQKVRSLLVTWSQRQTRKTWGPICWLVARCFFCCLLLLSLLLVACCCFGGCGYWNCMEKRWTTLHQIQVFWVCHPLKWQDSFVSMLMKYHHLSIDGWCLRLNEVSSDAYLLSPVVSVLYVSLQKAWWLCDSVSISISTYFYPDSNNYPHLGASWTMFAGGQVGDQDPWGQLEDKIVMK